MTINDQKQGWKLYNHQVILMDEKGAIYESCDSIFDSNTLIGSPLSEHIHFFESELNTILNSKASKITFEKIKLTFEYLPGYYDFIFSKQEFDGNQIIVWEIYDYTRIYEEFAIVQQLQNEIEIKEQYQKNNFGPKSINKDSIKFFQSNYISESKFDMRQLLNDFITSKFDIFDLFSDELDAKSMQEEMDELKNCVNYLAKEIKYFVRNLKNTKEEEVDVRGVFQALFQDSVCDQTIMEYNFSDTVPQKVRCDQKLVAKLIEILLQQKKPNRFVKLKSIELQYDQYESGLTNLTLFLRKELDSVSAFAASSLSTFLKLSILRSLTAMIGGNLHFGFNEQKAVFAVNMVIPIK